MKSAQAASDKARPVRGFFLIVGIAVFLTATNVAESLDLALLDNWHRLLAERYPKPVSSPVVIVGIDDAAMRSYPEPLALWHAHLGNFFKAMALAKPAVVGVDLVLPSRSYDALAPGLDRRLLEGLVAARASTRIVLGLTTDGNGKPREIHAPFLAMLPQDAIGYVLLPIDGDNVVRRFNERLGSDGQIVTTLAGQMARALGVVPAAGWIDYAYGAQNDYIPLPKSSAGWPRATQEEVSLARPDSAAPISRWIAFGWWLEQQELKDEARKVWQRALAQRADDARLRRCVEN